MATFDSYTLLDAQRVVLSRENPEIANYRAFYNGDHWQTGAGWTGPLPKGSDVGQSNVEIEKSFVSRNAIAEVVNRHDSGVLGRALHWKFTVKRPLAKAGSPPPGQPTAEPMTEDETPTPDETTLIEEAEAALQAWMDEREVQEILQQVCANVLVTQRGCLRLYIPPDLRDETGRIVVRDLEEALKIIYLHHLGTNEDTLVMQPPNATVYQDKRSRQEIGIYTYLETTADARPGDLPSGEERAELCYLANDPNKTTVYRVVNNAGDVEEPVLMPLGGRLLLYEMTRMAFLNPQIISLQKSLNLTLTMSDHNVLLAGFVERILLNGQLPGHYETEENGDERFIPDPFYTGAGSLNTISGLEVKDASGNTGFTTPQMVYRDPVDVTTFTDKQETTYLALLQETQQLHYATVGDGSVSGESRKQARDAYEKDLRVTAGKMEAAARWILETALALAAYLTNQPGRFDVLRAFVECRVDTGPVSAEEMNTAIKMHDAGLWSRERSQSYSGVEDVDAEQARIDLEAGESQPLPDLSALQNPFAQSTPTAAVPATNGAVAPVTPGELAA